jgi:hypothetical protein
VDLTFHQTGEELEQEKIKNSKIVSFLLWKIYKLRLMYVYVNNLMMVFYD